MRTSNEITAFLANEVRIAKGYQDKHGQEMFSNAIAYIQELEKTIQSFKSCKNCEILEKEIATKEQIAFIEKNFHRYNEVEKLK